MSNELTILRIAVPSPLRQSFDYLPPEGVLVEGLSAGVRVRVPFGRRQVVGLLLGVCHEAQCDVAYLRCAIEVLDKVPLLPDVSLRLRTWASDYYHHPVGDVMLGTLPKLLCEGRPAVLRGVRFCCLSAAGLAEDINTLRCAKRQMALVTLLRQHPEGLSLSHVRAAGFAAAHWQALIEKAWVHIEERTPECDQKTHVPSVAHTLNAAQREAVDAMRLAPGFQTFLLDGVTGSGKTEVYLRVIEKVIASGRQAMVLVPEIGLTPQTVRRFQQRFPVKIALLHSALNDRERHDAWLMAARGLAPIVIGTRSAVFTPLAKPGVIIVDEEHDHSFKQQAGFRYSARDVAVVRGRLEDCPVILGSATPAFETLHNAARCRYQHFKLPERAGVAVHPTFQVIDVRNQSLDHGISLVLKQAIQSHLDRDGQILLFLNRRGFAPVLLCHACGWTAECNRCDAKMTLHRAARHMRCHHCNATRPIDRVCPACQSQQLLELGLGTQRVELAVQENFPGVKVVRIDRDTTQRKGAMQRLLADVRSGDSQILVGTQMLAKGHHLPNITLVALLDVDSGLMSGDFRAAEQLAQLVVQVAGRAGRAQKPGEVLIQTHNPHHPLLLCLIREGYHAFAKTALTERRAASLPPFSHLALIRAEALQQSLALRFLEEVRDMASTWQDLGMTIYGPIPAAMCKRAGHFRAQLLFHAKKRQVLHAALGSLSRHLGQLKSARKVRWSLDVDPMETS